MSDTTNPKDALGLKKPPLRLVPAAGLLHVAKVMGLGAAKYGPYNWRGKPVRLTVYIEAAMRHLLSALDGETDDRESGQPHAAHAAACMMIVLDAAATGNLVDDRPPPGAAARLIVEMTEKSAPPGTLTVTSEDTCVRPDCPNFGGKVPCPPPPAAAPGYHVDVGAGLKPATEEMGAIDPETGRSYFDGYVRRPPSARCRRPSVDSPGYSCERLRPCPDHDDEPPSDGFPPWGWPGVANAYRNALVDEALRRLRPHPCPDHDDEPRSEEVVAGIPRDVTIGSRAS